MNRLMVFVLIFIGYSAMAQVPMDSAALKKLDSLLNISKNLREKGELDKSFELALAIEKEALEKFGRNSVVYGNSCINRGKWHLAKSEHKEAEKWYFEAIDIFKTLYGTEHNLYAKALNNLGVLYYWMGKFEKSEPIYLQVRDIQEKAVGLNHIDFAVSLNNLALLYKELGRYDIAEPYYKNSYALFKKILGENHPQYARSVTNLGVFYFITGNYAKAEPLYLESKEVREKSIGKKHPDYGVSLTNLGTLYSEMGNLNKAESYFLEATQIFEQVVGKNHPQYAQSLYNLASLYIQLNKDNQTLELLLEAKAILLNELGTKHPDYVNCIQLLARAYKTVHNFEQAELYQLEALEIQKEITGKNHQGYARALIGLAKLYMDTDRDLLAEPLLSEAHTILKQELGIDFSGYASTVFYLALVNENKKNYKQANFLLNEYVTLDQEKLIKSVNYLSSEELNKYAEVISNHSGSLQSINYRRKYHEVNTTELSKTILNMALFQKGFVLNAASRLNLLTGETIESKELNAKLQGYKRRLAKEYSKNNIERNNQEITELEDKTNGIEKELAQKVLGYSEAISQVKWEAVQSKLLPDEAVLEFVNFKLDFPKETDSVLYVAILLRAEDSLPVFIPLFEEKQLSLILNTFPAEAQSALYASRGASPVKVHNYSSLFDLVWKPIDPYLIYTEKIYMTTSGMLHRLNFNAMEIANDSILGDKFKLVQLGSTRQLVLTQNKIWDQTSAVLFGGINYDLSDTIESTNFDSQTKSNLDTNTTAINTSTFSAWSFLPGTDQEVGIIQEQFKKRKIPVTQYRGANATESQFKQIGNGNASPRILHISTHGYFFPDPKDKQLDTSLNNTFQAALKFNKQPMLRSGLIFAGGNKAWQGIKTKDGEEDGILTAYEISQMNLSNTELVVLSACETGLGDIQGNEGVYGLQRAFKIAGAKYLIMSLWQVPDKQTSLLMTTFYKKWLEAKGPTKVGNTLSIPDAFRAAQKELRDGGLEPYYWAGFVLVE
ncbi:MAG: CHAT domain-containing protein [Saprospiraceae bacterium]|nr:CHAT domain-containing protein [Saprospiraceae bacterium]